MPDTLIAFAIWISIVWLLIDWKFTAKLVLGFGILTLVIGLPSALLALIVFGSLVLVLEPFPAVVLGGTILVLATIFGLQVSVAIISSIFAILFLLLFLGLYDGPPTLREALSDAIHFPIAILLTVFSTFVNRIELLGTTFSVNCALKYIYTLYPGSNFPNELRDDFVERAADYADEGVVDVQGTSESLAQDVRSAYDNAGRSLTDGEANIALILAIVSTVPFFPSTFAIPPWLTPPDWSGVVLSVTLLIAVGLRKEALQAILYQNATITDQRGRLAAKAGWNQYMSNGAKVLKVIAQFRAIKAISTSAYNYYMDWVLEESLNGNGADTVGLLSQWRELMCFVVSDRQDVSPSEASLQLFSKDIFEEEQINQTAIDPPSHPV